MNPNLPKIALVGRPNVGKSTLFNRFIGRRLALVDERSGIVPQDLNWLKKIRQIQKPYLVAVNKIDTAKTDVLAVEFYETGEKLNLISAEGGRGISELLDEVDVIIKKTFQSNITSSPEEDKPVGIALI